MMISDEDKNTVDGLRFIGTLHTVARQLLVCSKIVETVGGRQIPFDILNQLMSNWSKVEELKNIDYSNSTGKITEGGVNTTALKHYLNLCVSLKLLNNINSIYSSSRLAHLLIHVLRNKPNENDRIFEKLFYLTQLIMIDADGILLVLQQISKQAKAQYEVKFFFIEDFNQRLSAKKENAPSNVKASISEKYRKINFIWTKPEKYAEHLLMPRYEWLSSLGLISIKRSGSSTRYSISENGKLFLESIPLIQNSTIRDINESWIKNQMFTTLGNIYKTNQIRSVNLSQLERASLIGSLLENATQIIKTSHSSKLPLWDTVLYICLSSLCYKGVSLNISDVYDSLHEGIYFNSKLYTMKTEMRINEGYILINRS